MTVFHSKNCNLFLKAILPCLLFLLTGYFQVHAQLTDQGVNVKSVEEKISWDSTPIKTTTFNNGEDLNIVEEDWQWISYCSKRKPSVWIKDEDGEKVYYYNFYAITDSRGLTQDKAILPTVETIRNNQIPGFPSRTFTKGYLEQDSENKLVTLVSPPSGDQYYWTSTKHESAAQGEEVAYVFKYSQKTQTISTSTGQYCDGYPALSYSTKVGDNYSYKQLLPAEFNTLEKAFANVLVREPGLFDNMKYEFNAILKFDNQGLNKSRKFNLDVANDPSNKKSRITSLYALDELITNYFKYPKYNGLPLQCSDSINITIHTVWTGPQTIAKKDNLSEEFLPEDFKSNFIRAAKMGKARQVERAFILDVDGDLAAYKQKIIRGFNMRGPMTVLLSPLGFGLKSVTNNYSKGYRTGAKTIGIVLALITPFAIVSTYNGYSNMVKYQNDLTPLNVSRFEQAKKQATISASIYGISFTANFIGSLILGSKNKKMQKRINGYLDERYPYGIVVDYVRK